MLSMEMSAKWIMILATQEKCVCLLLCVPAQGREAASRAKEEQGQPLPLPDVRTWAPTLRATVGGTPDVCSSFLVTGSTRSGSGSGTDHGSPMVVE